LSIKIKCKPETLDEHVKTIKLMFKALYKKDITPNKRIFKRCLIKNFKNIQVKFLKGEAYKYNYLNFLDFYEVTVIMHR